MKPVRFFFRLRRSFGSPTCSPPVDGGRVIHVTGPFPGGIATQSESDCHQLRLHFQPQPVFISHL